MNLDEHLSDLLTERATQGSSVRPSMDGVQQAIGRLARRRQRQRAVGTGLAALCVVAGIAGGFALAGGDDEASIDSTADPALPAVPLVGVSVDGLVLRESHQPMLGPDQDALHYAVFTDPEGEVDGPAVTVAQVEIPEAVDPVDAGYVGDPVDLDGDGRADDGVINRRGEAVTVSWIVDDVELMGTYLFGVGGYDIDEADLLAYVRSLDRNMFEPETAPAPDGLSTRQIIDIPSRVGATEAYSIYDGLGGTVHVVSTNAPGWFDITRVGLQPSTTEVVPVESTLLGPGTALFGNDTASSSTMALVRTDEGLTVQITATDIDPDVVRQMLTDDRLIDLTAAEGPTPTTATVPVTTTRVSEPVTPTTVGGSTTRITGITIEPGSELDRLKISFSGSVPDYTLTTATEAFDVDCHGPVSDGGDYLLLRLAAPPGTGLDEWEGILEISPDPNGAIQGVLSCGWSDGDGAAYVSIELDQPREGETSTVLGQPILVIDVPRS